MLPENSDLSDEHLLMELDGELSADDKAIVCAHLEACWECRARCGKIEAAIKEFVGVHLQDFDGEPSPAGRRLGFLRAKLAPFESATASGSAGLRGPMKIAAAALTITVLFSSVVVFLRHRLESRPAPVEVCLPDSRLTPGAATPANTQAVRSRAGPTRNRSELDRRLREILPYGSAAGGTPIVNDPRSEIGFRRVISGTFLSRPSLLLKKTLNRSYRQGIS